jgi:hypothetical protein
MPEPDEALLWAREDCGEAFRRFKPHLSEAILNGDWDDEVGVRLIAHGYRAGAAASEARIEALEAALRPSMWVGPTGIDISFSAPGRPISLPGTAGGSGGYSQSTSTPVDDSGRTDTEVKEPRND